MDKMKPFLKIHGRKPYHYKTKEETIHEYKNSKTFLLIYLKTNKLSYFYLQNIYISDNSNSKISIPIQSILNSSKSPF